MVRYDMPDEKGETRRQRNERFGEGDKNPEIEEVDEIYQYLLDWFFDLSSLRTPGFNGPNPLSFSDYANWQKLTGHLITREELNILRELDQAYLKAVEEETKPVEENSYVDQRGRTRPGG